MRRRVWMAVGALGLALAGATASAWLVEFRRPNVRVEMTDKDLRRAIGDQAEPMGGPRCRADGDKDLDGEWELQPDGKEGSPPPKVKFLLAFKGGSLRFVLAAKEGDEREALAQCAVKVDATAAPKSLDMISNEDARKERIRPCIYEVNGDELRICSPGPLEFDKPRPTELSAKEGSGYKLDTYHRVKQ